MEGSDYTMDERTTQIVLLHTCEYLDTFDLLMASEVSKQWYSIAQRHIYWRRISLKSCNVTNPEGLADAMERHQSKTVDLRTMNVYRKWNWFSSSQDLYWSRLLSNIGKSPSLKRLYLGKCPTPVTCWFLGGNMLKSIEMLSLDFCGGTSGPVNLSHFQHFEKLEELHMTFRNVRSVLKYSLPAMKSLKYLSVKNKSRYVRNCWDQIAMEGSKYIGEFPQILLPHAPNLRKLKLEDTSVNWESTRVFQALSGLDKLEELVLLNITVSADIVGYLKKCKNLKKLFISPSHYSVLTAHQLVLTGAIPIRKSLISFKLGVYHRFFLNLKGEHFCQMESCVHKKRPVDTRELLIPFSINCHCKITPCANNNHFNWVTLDFLRNKMSHDFPNMKTKVIHLP